ncbi:hypothetical protein GQ53DRAFT_815648 [Thozetella sp. PMI_491]|nr:hypothetical protein GQ53DRAFT_815648 [Thozetella sp. PMI_491]
MLVVRQPTSADLLSFTTVQTKLITLDVMESGYLPNPSNATAEENWNSDKLWSDLMPVGNGFVVATQGPEQLPEAQWVPQLQENLYQIAVYHQIYCLTTILMAYNQTVQGYPQEWAPIAQCFNYLRESLMCHADTTLEGKDDDPTTYRVCKDYGEIRDWAQAHRQKPKKIPQSRARLAGYHQEGRP